MRRVVKHTPKRLSLIYQSRCPLYLVTFNTHVRRRLLARSEVHRAFKEFCIRGLEMGACVGRYVLMPDHVHAFVAIGHDMELSRWVKGVKQHLDKTLRAAGDEPARLPGQRFCSFWQLGYLDHLLRSDESYAEKWNYVWANPVRAGLVGKPEDWKYQGEIAMIDRA